MPCHSAAWCFSSCTIVSVRSIKLFFFLIQQSRIDCFILLNHRPHTSLECPCYCLICTNRHCWAWTTHLWIYQMQSCYTGLCVDGHAHLNTIVRDPKSVLSELSLIFPKLSIEEPTHLLQLSTNEFVQLISWSPGAWLGMQYCQYARVSILNIFERPAQLWLQCECPPQHSPLVLEATGYSCGSRLRCFGENWPCTCR